MAKINEIIKIEEILLMIEDKCKFELTLSQNIALMELLDRISKITDLYFTIQSDYYKLMDKDKFKEYHDMLVSEEIDVDIEPYKRFIDSIHEKIGDNNIFNDIWDIRFW